MMRKHRKIMFLIQEKKRKQKSMKPEKKEIIYNAIDRFAVVVADGEYRGVKYVCINRGKHPCAYVFCPKEFLDKHVSEEYQTIENLMVHGGITYTGIANDLLGLEDYDGYCFGWDYGHAGDWAGYISEEENSEWGHIKYTTDMLISDCMAAIDQYLDIVDKDTNGDSNNILTRDILLNLGFKSVFDTDDVFQLTGGEGENKWKVLIDLKTPTKSYVITQRPRQRYEGTITTFDELKAVIKLFNLPIEIEL